MGTAWILWVTIATLAGVLAAVKRYSLIDQVITFLSYVFYSLPTFWLGLILIFIFGVELRLFPAQGIINVRTSPAPFATDAYWKAFAANPWPQLVDVGQHLVLPVATLIAVSVAGDSRFVRSAMLESLSQDYVRTARAKGLPGRTVVFRHAFRNALLPIVTNIALEIAFLFGGAIATETVFSWPGMGLLFYDGVNGRDYFLLMGILLIGSLFIVFMNLVADVLYVMVDPRIRYD
jgi:peptide/nickel transport system permease protein